MAEEVVGNVRIPSQFQARVLNAIVSSVPTGQCRIEVAYSDTYGGVGQSPAQQIITTTGESVTPTSFFPESATVGGDLVIRLFNVGHTVIDVTASLMLSMRPIAEPGGAILTMPPIESIGLAPAHQWNGTSLQFQNPDGSWGPLTDLKPADGASVTATTGPQGPPPALRMTGTLLQVQHAAGSPTWDTLFDFSTLASTSSTTTSSSQTVSANDFVSLNTVDIAGLSGTFTIGTQAGAEFYDYVQSGTPTSVSLNVATSARQSGGVMTGTSQLFGSIRAVIASTTGIVVTLPRIGVMGKKIQTAGQNAGFTNITIGTNGPHNFSIGTLIAIDGLHSSVNGVHTVTDVPSTDTFIILKSGEVSNLNPQGTCNKHFWTMSNISVVATAVSSASVNTAGVMPHISRTRVRTGQADGTYLAPPTPTSLTASSIGLVAGDASTAHIITANHTAPTDLGLDTGDVVTLDFPGYTNAKVTITALTSTSLDFKWSEILPAFAPSSWSVGRVLIGNIVAITQTSGVATITLNANHSYVENDPVAIYGHKGDDSIYNGSYTVYDLTDLPPNQIKVVLPSSDFPTPVARGGSLRFDGLFTSTDTNFVSTDVGKIIKMMTGTSAGTELKILGYISTTRVKVTPLQDAVTGVGDFDVIDGSSFTVYVNSGTAIPVMINITGAQAVNG